MSNKIKITPLGDRILLKPLAADGGKKTKSGIIIPETVSKEKPEQGKVIAVGLGRVTDEGKRIPISVKKGDTVLFAKYAPDEVKIDGEEYFIISESSILAVIE
ncbi:MAG: co-chaperone GroES [Patescibacteria group bacterium]